jgi:hypothetical protein
MKLKSLGLIMLALASPTVNARASIPDGDGTYFACYEKSDGSLRLIDSAKQHCSHREELQVTWKATAVGTQGPVGPPGPAGAPGASVSALPVFPGDLTCPNGGTSFSIGGTIVGYACNGGDGVNGLPGAKGDTGAAGAQGPQGLQGVAGPQGPAGPPGSSARAGAIYLLAGACGGGGVLTARTSCSVPIQSNTGIPGCSTAPACPAAPENCQFQFARMEYFAICLGLDADGACTGYYDAWAQCGTCECANPLFGYTVP